MRLIQEENKMLKNQNLNLTQEIEQVKRIKSEGKSKKKYLLVFNFKL